MSFRLIDLNVRVYCYDLAVNLYSPLCVQVGFFTFHSPNTNTIVDAGVGGNSRSWPFLGVKVSHSIPEFWEWIFVIHFWFPNIGIRFFMSFLFPNFGNESFHSFPVPKLLGMDFCHPLLVSKCWNQIFYVLPVPKILGMNFFIPFLS